MDDSTMKDPKEMTIEQLLKLASFSNLMHFPQGVEIVREDGGNFGAYLLGKTGENGQRSRHCPYSSRNKTPDGALDDLKNFVHNRAKEHAKSKHNEAVSANDELNRIMEAT